MSVLLTRIPTDGSLTSKDFAAKFKDSDFNGTATEDELVKFCQLAWKCISRTEGKSLDRVHAVFSMSTFVGLGPSAAFPNLNVKIVIFQIVLRLLKPERVNQDQFGLCGPAHFIITLIKSKPQKYVGMAYDLLTKGRTTGDDGFEVAPDKYVTAYDPSGKIPEADWLIAASLRNAQTEIPEGKEGRYTGTNASEVYAYFVHAGYKEAISLACHSGLERALAHLVVPPQFRPAGLQIELERFARDSDIQQPDTNVRIASWLRAQGWRVMIQINSKLLTQTPPDAFIREAARDSTNPMHEGARAITEKSWAPVVSKKSYLLQNTDHWVLVKNLEVKSGQVSLAVYTWGTQKKVKGEVPLEEFKNAYSGFVAARG